MYCWVIDKYLHSNNYRYNESLNIIYKVLGQSKQILKLAGVCRLEGADVMKLIVTSPPSLGRSLANTQPVQTKMFQDLLLLDRQILLSSEIFRSCRATILNWLVTAFEAVVLIALNGQLPY